MSSAAGRTGIDTSRARLAALDCLRGLVMVLMALDHVRDFVSASAQDPRDVTQPALFLTRWVTHFCAPVFVLLAGSSAFLREAAGRGRADTRRFLLTRGLWLVLLEITVVRFAWFFALDGRFFVAQVIWAIGWSMVALAALVALPRAMIATLALAMIAGHNAFDGVRAQQLGRLGWAWIVLHQGGAITPIAGTTLYVAYPLMPWLGVMAAGYAFGPTLLLDDAVRRRRLRMAGLAACAGFVVLRAVGSYGDPKPWAPPPGVVGSALAFLNCEKYPPSLLFLLMTLGPAMLLLPALEGRRGWLARLLVTIGRVPLMYYVVHLLLIHMVAIVIAQLTHGDTRWLLGGLSFLGKPPGYGLGLPSVYAVWIAVVAALVPLCRQFAQVKARRRDWWLSYF